MSGFPKRIKKTHDSTSRKRKDNKRKRQAGLNYVGFSVKNGKMKQDNIRMERKMGSPCSSPFCAKSKLRHCGKFNEDIRSTIFTSFWQDLKSWESKKMFVQGLVRRTSTQNSIEKESSRKPFSQYFLFLNGERFQVISGFLCNTLFEFDI